MTSDIRKSLEEDEYGKYALFGRPLERGGQAVIAVWTLDTSGGPETGSLKCEGHLATTVWDSANNARWRCEDDLSDATGIDGKAEFASLHLAMEAVAGALEPGHRT